MSRTVLVAVAGALVFACAGPNTEEGQTSGGLDETSPADLDETTRRNSSDQTLGSRKKHVGTLTTLLQGLRTESTHASKRFVFPAGPFGQVRVEVDDFYHEAGQLSMVGKPLDGTDAEFMLKANESGAYGWIVYRDRNVAFEYTTDARGNVLVEEVPVTKIFPVCNFEVPDAEADSDVPGDAEPTWLRASPMMPPHVGTYSNADVTKLQSLPGAPKVWYIELTEVMNGTTPIGQTPTDVWQTWQSLAATLSAFNVNVTTDRDVYMAAGTANSGIAHMDNENEGSSSCGVNVFGSTRACDVNRYRNGYSTGRILAHEVGHGLGMLHDGGDNGGEYFNGLSAFQWTPLMGNIWPGDRWMNALYQWSKGEYTSATRQEDDFANIDRHLDYRADDIPSTKPLSLQGTTVAATSNWGQIGRNTDTDSFSFRIGSAGGRADLRIDRIEYLGGAMLDVDASIVNASGTAVMQHNAPVARFAELDTALEAGDYTLVIKGGAEGTPANGFSNYSSVGFYAIDGTITGAIDGGGSGTGGMGGGAGMGGASGSSGVGGSGGVSGSGGSPQAGMGGSGAGSLGGGSGGSISGGAGAGPSDAGNGGAGSGASGAPMGGSAGNPGAAGSSVTAGSGAYPAAPVGSTSGDEAGCGCRTNPKSGAGSAWLFAIALAGLGAFRRRIVPARSVKRATVRPAAG
jgi:MYXO-CTERM domain-containing protein